MEWPQRVPAVLAAALVLSALSACAGKPPPKPAATPASAEPTTKASAPGCAVTPVVALRNPMKVVAHLPTVDPAFATLAPELRALLERYRAEGAGRFAYSFADTNDPAALKIEYGAENGNVTLEPTRTSGLEYSVAAKLREVRLRAEGPSYRIGVLTGHDEIKLSEANLVPTSNSQKPNLQKIIAQYFPYYELVDVDLTKNKGAAIDDSRRGRLITQPGTDLADDELTRIDDFVLKGRSLAVVASAVNVPPNDPAMVATLSAHRLEKLLDGYGIGMRKDVLEDFGRPLRIEVVTGSSGERNTIRFPPILEVSGDDGDLDATFPVLFRIPKVSFPYASSLVLHPEMQPGIARGALKMLARSSAKTGRETKDQVGLQVLRQWRPTSVGEYVIAATVDGLLRSAFPERNNKVAARPARVLVLSSSHFFANPFARASAGDTVLDHLAAPYAQNLLTQTILVARNMLDWMTMDDALLACASESP